jgi:heptosyltransferase III
MAAGGRVLIIRGGAVGDFILTLPALRLLRESLPDNQVEVLGYPGITALAVAAGLADRTRALEHGGMARLFARGAAIDPELAAYLSGFNLVLSYLYDPDGIFRDNLARAGVKTLIECPHQVLPGQGHAAVQLARSLERLALFLEDGDWRRPFFPRRAPQGDEAVIALHAGSGSERKNWPLERWLEVANGLRAGGCRVVFVTGEAEEARGQLAQIPAGWEVWHQRPLPELAGLLGGCSGFLGHDSGMSHLAAACGLPCLLLFGPTDPEVWAPPQAGVRVLRAADGDLAALPAGEVVQAAWHWLGEIAPDGNGVL